MRNVNLHSNFSTIIRVSDILYLQTKRKKSSVDTRSLRSSWSIRFRKKNQVMGIPKYNVAMGGVCIWVKNFIRRQRTFFIRFLPNFRLTFNTNNSYNYKISGLLHSLLIVSLRHLSHCPLFMYLAAMINVQKTPFLWNKPKLSHQVVCHFRTIGSNPHLSKHLSLYIRI